MKKIIASIFMVCLLAAAAVVGAEEMQPVTDQLKKDFPQLQFQNVAASPVDGLYEIVAGSNVIYYSPKAKVIMVGEMWSKEGKSLTSVTREKMTAEAIKSLPLDKAIKIGSGKNTVIMFTDPDCPFCRKIEEYFKDKNDITRYVFLLPLEQLHPKATAKSLNIMSQKNKGKAFLAAMNGALDNVDVKPVTNEKVIALLKENKAMAQKLGINGTPYIYVNGTPVRGADANAIEKLLK